MFHNLLVSKKNVLAYSVFLFLILFYILAFIIKPAFLYNDDGSIKQFGLGFQQKTIIPFWLMTIGIAVISYLTMLYFSIVKIEF